MNPRITGISFIQQGEELRLTSGEIELLIILAQHHNRVLTRDQLMDLLNSGSHRVFHKKCSQWSAN